MVDHREPSGRRTSRERRPTQQTAGSPSPGKGIPLTARESSGSPEKHRRGRQRVSTTPPPKAVGRKSNLWAWPGASSTASMHGTAAPGVATGMGYRRAWSAGSIRRPVSESSSSSSGVHARESGRGQANGCISSLVADVREEVKSLKDLLHDGSAMEGGFEDSPRIFPVDTSDSIEIEGLLARIETAFRSTLPEPEPSVSPSKKAAQKKTLFSSPFRRSPERQSPAADSQATRSPQNDRPVQPLTPSTPTMSSAIARSPRKEKPTQPATPPTPSMPSRPNTPSRPMSRQPAHSHGLSATQENEEAELAGATGESRTQTGNCQLRPASSRGVLRAPSPPSRDMPAPEKSAAPPIQTAPTTSVTTTAQMPRSSQLAVAPSGPKPTKICDASHCRWEVVQLAAEERGWKMVREGDEVNQCNIRWVDDQSIRDVHPRVQPWMRVNHFPGMSKTLGRKCRLARNMKRMHWIFPSEFNFLPRTWVLPDDWDDLSARFTKEINKDDKAYIVKPDGGSQGRGIFLTSDLETLRRLAKEGQEKDQSYAVQKYISRPMLIEGFKFDLRLYVLVAGVMVGAEMEPRIFLFRDGLVRLCTTEYQQPSQGNMDQTCMHLTNYEVNRTSDQFHMNKGLDEVHTGSKRSLVWLLGHIADVYGEEESRRVWFELVSVCTKTVLAAQPTLESEYYASCPKDHTMGHMGCRCFEVLGFDVLLTNKRQAMLIEVNHLPSLAIHSPLDQDVKTRLIGQAMDMTCSSAIDQPLYSKMVRGGLPAELQTPDQLLEAQEYKDFERTYPPRDDCPAELASSLKHVLATVRKVFRPVMTAGLRRSPSESAIRESSGSSAGSTASTKASMATLRSSWAAPPTVLRELPSTKDGKQGRLHAENLFKLQMGGRSAW